MKFIALLSAIVCVSSAQASPYFRIIDPAHPKPVLGALVDPHSIKDTQATSLLPLVTHSHKDGCLIPTLCETWSPVAIGGAINAGKATFIVAPLFGLAPWMQKVVEITFPDVTFQKDPAVEISFGPAWEYQQTTNKGYFRIYSGLKLNF